MNFVIPSFAPAIPEMVLLALTSFILVGDTIWSKRSQFATYYMAQATLVVVGLLIMQSFAMSPEITFSGSFIRDRFGDILKLFILLTSVGVLVFAKEYLIQFKFYQGEFFSLALFGILGMFVMVSAYNLITLYLGLEIMSLALYAMIAMRKDYSIAIEAAMKYFVLGALATGMLLYGFSMVYGATGQIQFDKIAQAIASGQMNMTVLSFGLVFVVIGLAFKLGAVPFHMWMPDVYEGSPTGVTLYLATAPKIAAFAMFYRLLVEALPGLVIDWQSLLIMLSVLSLIVGSVAAIVQTNIKRMLAYSGVGHVGFILLGLIAATPSGYAAGMVYVIIYAFTGVAGFGLIAALSKTGKDVVNISDLAGLNQQSPWLALMMMFVMFSMAGIPPFIGFYAKLLVIEEVVNSGFVGLAVIAVIMAVVSAFYYLKVVKTMYFDEPAEGLKLEAISQGTYWTVSLFSLALLVWGLFPSFIISLCYTSLGAQ